MLLSIIIPVYNEENTIIDVINKVNSINFNIKKEIIVVNDGSTDKTYEKLMEIKKRLNHIKIINYKNNKGKGFAIRKGFQVSTGDIAVIQDADLELNPRQISRLIQPITNNQYKVVYGSRFKSGGFFYKPKNMRFISLFANKILTYIFNILFHSHLTDTQTCYKTIHRDVLKKLELNSNSFEIESEITYRLLKGGYKIIEVPVDYFPRNKQQGKKIRWKHAVKNLIVIFKMKFNLM